MRNCKAVQTVAAPIFRQLYPSFNVKIPASESTEIYKRQFFIYSQSEMPSATRFHYNLFSSFPLLFLEIVPQTDGKPLALAKTVLENIV